MVNSETLASYLSAHSFDPLAGIKGLDFSHAHAHMCCGREVGALLHLLVLLHKPRRVLELGTMLGYSTLCMATAMQMDAKMDTIEMREDDFLRARGHINRAGLSHIVHTHFSDAQVFLRTHAQDTWDFIFIDADKKSYPTYYEMLVPRMSVGAVMVVDNALFHGQVLRTSRAAKAQAIHTLNDRAQADGRVRSVLLNVRDGVLLIVKIADK